MARQHFSHEHPLVLFNEVPKDDSKEEVVCYGCQKPITSSAYSCIKCKYFLHKKCGELPQGIKHPMHPKHPLALLPHSPYKGLACRCNVCGIGDWKWFTYHCSKCKFNVHVSCTPLEERTIENKFHNHPLAFTQRTASLFCDACGTEGEDLSFRCTNSTCQFSIHDRCASSTSSVKRNDHDHPLDLAYCFPHSHRNFDHYCYICKKIVHPTYWVYHCISCRYFVHLKCATSYEPLRLSVDKSDTKDVYSSLIHFPLPDEPEDSVRQFVNDNVFGDIENVTECLFCDSADDLVQFEVQSDNDKQNKDSLCDVCVQPISFPFYTCGHCGFILHKNCSHLAKEIQHPYHQHTLSLQCIKKYFKVFRCSRCSRCIDGIHFSCESCNFHLGVCCATTSLPNTIKHEAHNHPLLQSHATTTFKCTACGNAFANGPKYGCDACDFHLDTDCAMLPNTIRHDWDRHPISLAYPPFYYHPDDFYCEICEEQMHPNYWLYHCRKCDQSFHAKCLRPLDMWSNIKFGDAYTFEDHSHKLAFVRKGKNKSPSPCDHCGKTDNEDIPFLECATCNFQVCMVCAREGDTRSTRMEVADPYYDSFFSWIVSTVSGIFS